MDDLQTLLELGKTEFGCGTGEILVGLAHVISDLSILLVTTSETWRTQDYTVLPVRDR